MWGKIYDVWRDENRLLLYMPYVLRIPFSCGIIMLFFVVDYVLLLFTDNPIVIVYRQFLIREASSQMNIYQPCNRDVVVGNANFTIELFIQYTKINFSINTVMTENCNTISGVDEYVNHSDEYIDHRNCKMTVEEEWIECKIIAIM